VFFTIRAVKDKTLAPVIWSSIIIGMSFMANYMIMLAPTIGSDHMQDFHDSFFMTGRFWDVESLSHDFGLIVSQARMVVGKSGLAIGAVLTLVLTSLYNFIKEKDFRYILLFLPIMGAFGASMIGMYSILDRLMLFALPLYILLACKGLEFFVTHLVLPKKYGAKILGGVLILGLLVGFVEKQSFKYIVDPFEHEDNRSGLLSIAEHPFHDKTIICSQHAVAAYEYYSKFDIRYRNLKIGKAIKTKYGDDISKIALERLEKEDEVWVLLNHFQEKNIEKMKVDLSNVAKIKKSYRANASAAFLMNSN